MLECASLYARSSVRIYSRFRCRYSLRAVSRRNSLENYPISIQALAAVLGLFSVTGYNMQSWYYESYCIKQIVQTVIAFGGLLSDLFDQSLFGIRPAFFRCSVYTAQHPWSFKEETSPVSFTICSGLASLLTAVQSSVSS